MESADTYMNALAGGDWRDNLKYARGAASNNTVILVAALLFIALSPGVLLTLPAINPTNGCSASDDPFFKSGVRDWFISGQTNLFAVLVHAVVFAACLWVAGRYGNLQMGGNKIGSY